MNGEPLVIIAPPPELVDALGAPLREEPRGTFSNAPEVPPPTLESIGQVVRELRLETRSPRFRTPPPILEDYGDAFMPSYSTTYGAMRGRPSAVFRVIMIDDEPEPAIRRVFRRCVSCGAAKRTMKRQRLSRCARCSQKARGHV